MELFLGDVPQEVAAGVRLVVLPGHVQQVSLLANGWYVPASH